MISYFQNIRNNILIKIGSFNSIGVLVTSLVGVVSVKVIAISLGAEGMALIGNLRNFLSTIQSVGTLGLYNGVVKYVSEHKNNKRELATMLSTSYYVCFVVTMILAAWLYYDPGFWNDLIFGKQYNFNFIFKAAGIALPFYCANIMSLAIINGFSKYKVFIVLNIVTSIAGLFITILLIWQYDLSGAFYAIVINPAISLLITLVLILNQKNFAKFLLANQITFQYIKRLSSYSVMALVSALVLPLILIKIRNFIIFNEGVDQAGFWEAIRRISDQYMVFVTTLISLYLLPKLAEIKTSKGFKEEIFNFYRIILPIFIVGFIIIYILKDTIILLLFSENFMAMKPLFIWQLSGDLLRIIAITLACQLLAKRMFWPYIVTEILSFSVLYFSSLYLIKRFGFVGASMAHFFNYLIYLIMLIILFRKKIFSNKEKQVLS